MGSYISGVIVITIRVTILIAYKSYSGTYNPTV